MKFMQIDTREHPKAISEIVKTFDKEGVPHIRTKLLFGDYCDYNRPGIVIDRKQNIAELAKNCTSEHKRFREELERAKMAGAKLVILVEQDRYKNGGNWVFIRELTDIIYWSNPHTTIRGEKVYRVLASWCAKYDLEVQFCNKKNTGKRILEIIYNEKLCGK